LNAAVASFDVKDTGGSTGGSSLTGPRGLLLLQEMLTSKTVAVSRQVRRFIIVVYVSMIENFVITSLDSALTPYHC